MFWKIISNRDNTQIIIFKMLLSFRCCKYKHNFDKYQILIPNSFLKAS
jgi:hypothetical protein